MFIPPWNLRWMDDALLEVGKGQRRECPSLLPCGLSKVGPLLEERVPLGQHRLRASAAAVAGPQVSLRTPDRSGMVPAAVQVRDLIEWFDLGRDGDKLSGWLTGLPTLTLRKTPHSCVCGRLCHLQPSSVRWWVAVAHTWYSMGQSAPGLGFKSQRSTLGYWRPAEVKETYTLKHRIN